MGPPAPWVVSVSVSCIEDAPWGAGAPLYEP
jgi:hypothetical protein